MKGMIMKKGRDLLRRAVNPVKILFGGERFFVDIEEDMKDDKPILLVAGVHCCLTKGYLRLITGEEEL